MSTYTQLLTSTLRLPDAMQADTLRLLDASRQVTNTVIEMLWPRLDEFADGKFQAWKHLTSLMDSPDPHGSRQWRCEAETAGRILRAQAARKSAFDSILPILSEGLILPADPQDTLPVSAASRRAAGRKGCGKRPARKNRKELLKRVTDLREQMGDDADKLMLLTNVMEQACNFYLAHDRFPIDYFELQPIPTLKVGLLTLAADDGPKKGSVYHLRFEDGQAVVQLKTPDARTQGEWNWREPVTIPLPEDAQDMLAHGVPAAPQLRVLDKADGEQVAVMDLVFEVATPKPFDYANCERVLAFDWGVRTLLTMVVIDRDGHQISRPFFFKTGEFDGKQARLRRQIDELKAKRDSLPDPQDTLKGCDDTRRKALQYEIDLCWAAYSRRNKAMAHLASNVMLVIAGLYDCQIIAGEWLASLKSVGYGRNAQGRWRNWRNNSTLRSAITNVLRYKAKLMGLRVRFEFPRGTSHACPRCGKPADTFKSPDSDAPSDWGAWLKCANPECQWSGSRDYAAALNIGRLTIAYLVQDHTSKTQRGFRVFDSQLKPLSYSGSGAALPFPPPGSFLDCPCKPGTTTNIRGWPKACRLIPLSCFKVRASAMLG